MAIEMQNAFLYTQKVKAFTIEYFYRVDIVCEKNYFRGADLPVGSARRGRDSTTSTVQDTHEQIVRLQHQVDILLYSDENAQVSS